jgi:hypothetical protein
VGLDSLADLATEAFDVASEVLTDGFEFLSDGFDQFTEAVGSFAGDSEWFNTNNFGDIFGGPEALGDLGGAGFGGGFFDGITEFAGGLRDSVLGPELLGGGSTDFFGQIVGRATDLLPSVDQLAGQAQQLVRDQTGQLISGAIQTGAGAVTAQTAQIPFVGGAITGAVNRNAGAVNASINQQAPFRLSPIVPPAAFSVNGLVNSAISALTGSTAAVAQGLPRTPIGTVTVSGISDPLISRIPIPVPIPASQIDRSAGPIGYTSRLDPDTGTYSVVDVDTGQTVSTGLTEQQAQLQAQEQGFFDEGIPAPSETELQGPPLALAQNLTPEQLNQIAAAEGVDAGDVDIEVGTTEAQLFAQEAAATSALRDQARQQQTIRDQRANKSQSGDWRVRLRLGPTSNYLYNDPNCGPVLWPLQNTDGVIFPYTPAIDTGYKANYSAYDLTHSNYRGYFYQNSAVDQINVRATFTAQDTTEANYLLAVIHFFRSVTKMFYGQDAERGSPPPLCYLSGFGDYQFNEHPVVVSQFNYNLPADVNYIRAQTTTNVGTNIQPTARDRQSIAGNPLSYALQRLKTIGMTKGALDSPFAPSGSLGVGNPSYVPTKMEISLTLLPMQSRQQVSKQFSLKGFANGNLLRGGFW